MSASPTPQVFLWRYCENKRNYAGYHLTADAAGTQMLLQILRAHESTTKPLRSAVPLSATTPKILAVPANARGNSSVVGLGALHLTTDPSFAHGHFEFQESHPVCRLALSRQQAGCVAAGVEDIQRGKGDYCIGGDGDHVIWFWWFAGV